MKNHLKAILKVMLIILIVIALLIGGFLLYAKLHPNLSRTESWSDSDGTFYNELIYDEQKNLAYDLYIPSSVESDRLFLFVHGGGWNAGSKEELDFLARRYAKEGYVTATIDYTLLKEINPEITINTILAEVTSATSSIVKMCHTKSIELTSMAIGGESAGSHISMLYAWSKVDEQILPIRFVLDYVGPVDFHPDTWIGQSIVFGEENSYAGMISRFLGCEVTYKEIAEGAVEEELEALDPTTYLSAESAPIIMNYGEEDVVESSDHRELLKEALAKVGVSYGYYLYPNSGHGIAENDDYEIYQEMFNESLAFLNDAE